MDKLMVIQQAGEIGGSGLGLLSILNMLQSRFEIIVYCVDKPIDLLVFLRDRGFCVKAVGCVPVFPYYSGGPSALETNFVARSREISEGVSYWTKVIRDEGPTYVLVNSMIQAWMWKPIRLAGAKSICHVREVLPHKNNMFGARILNDLEKFDIVWFISEHEKKYFSLKKPSTAIIRDCLPKAFNSEEFCGAGRSNDRGKFRILFVGGFSQLKGIEVLISSIPFMNSRIELTIAGTVPNEVNTAQTHYRRFAFLKNLIHKPLRLKEARLWNQFQATMNRYPQQIRIVGHTIDLSEEYDHCDVLIFPSRKPHQSRPAFEAGFYGKPVIISDFEQTRENVVDGYNGLTFKPNDPNDLAKKVNMLCNDPSLCRRLGENNRENSIEKHSFDAVQAEMAEFWENYFA